MRWPAQAGRQRRRRIDSVPDRSPAAARRCPWSAVPRRRPRGRPAWSWRRTAAASAAISMSLTDLVALLQLLLTLLVLDQRSMPLVLLALGRGVDLRMSRQRRRQIADRRSDLQRQSNTLQRTYTCGREKRRVSGCNRAVQRIGRRCWQRASGFRGDCAATSFGACDALQRQPRSTGGRRTCWTGARAEGLRATETRRLVSDSAMSDASDDKQSRVSSTARANPTQHSRVRTRRTQKNLDTIDSTGIARAQRARAEEPDTEPRARRGQRNVILSRLRSNRNGRQR